MNQTHGCGPGGVRPKGRFGYDTLAVGMIFLCQRAGARELGVLDLCSGLASDIHGERPTGNIGLSPS